MPWVTKTTVQDWKLHETITSAVQTQSSVVGGAYAEQVRALLAMYPRLGRGYFLSAIS